MLPTLIGTTDPARYEQYLAEKIAAAYTTLAQAGLPLPKPQVVPSPPTHYRMRCEFALYKEEHDFKYAMFIPKTQPKQRVLLDTFSGAHMAINQGMVSLHAALKDDKEMLEGLFQTDFLCAQDGQLIIALNYHRKFDASFAEKLATLRQQLRATGPNVDLVARARKQKIVCKREDVCEHYALDGRAVKLYQVEGTFSQPNAAACEAMLNFARSCVPTDNPRDLLELYCGSGTFTVALADLFTKVLATEVGRVPTQTALRNLALNDLHNVKLCRLSAHEAASAIARERPFRRLLAQDIAIEDYHFSTLLVDPPRAGIQDDAALHFAAQFERIIYISCNPQTLALDLKVLGQTHKIVKLSFFDQFPYTPHLESGVLLLKR